MAKKAVLGRVIVLILLIIILIFAGLWWFDYLGLIRARNTFEPLYSLLGIKNDTALSSQALATADIDEDRYLRRMEALELKAAELDKREAGLKAQEEEILQRLQALDEREAAFEEKEKTFNETVNRYDNERVNLRQNAQYLTGMPPQNAVDILLNMDDQDVIDTLRMVEEIAQEEGSTSIVSYWMSLMPSDRAAVLQRKMASKPTQLP